MLVHISDSLFLMICLFIYTILKILLVLEKIFGLYGQRYTRIVIAFIEISGVIYFLSPCYLLYRSINDDENMSMKDDS
jgi:hypothetical protein